MSDRVDCLNCGTVWTRRAATQCPRCGRPEDPDWDAPVEPTEFEKRMKENLND